MNDRLMFSMPDYGDELGLFLHFGKFRYTVMETDNYDKTHCLAALRNLIDELKEIEKEIEENY